MKIFDKDESFSIITFDSHSEEEALVLRTKLMDDLSVFVDGYKFSPKYRSGIWDGKKYYFKVLSDLSMQIPKGLAETISLRYKDHLDEPYTPKTEPEFFSEADIQEHIKSLNLPFEPYDYQVDALREVLKHPRRIIVAATGAGKSLIVFLIMSFFERHGKKGLLIVPNVGLAEQMRSDFLSYGMSEEDADKKLHTIFAGKEKSFSKPMVVTTWQSGILMKESDYDQLDYVIVDECLHPNTPILTKDGVKKISEISVGEEVLTINENSGEYEYKKVRKVHKNLPKEQTYKLKTEDGKELIITGNHKVNTKRGWVRVDELLVGDDILSVS